MGNLLVIVAPSGTGKSTLIKKLRAEFPDLCESISYTTRPMRQGEENGRNYFFISEHEFKEKMMKGDFLEWARVHSHYYGTSKEYVEKALGQGQDLLFDLDVQGADAMKRHFGSTAYCIFIEPPSLEELYRRLIDRGTETPERIRERMENAKSELLRKYDYDLLITNDDFEQTLMKLKELFHTILQQPKKERAF